MRFLPKKSSENYNNDWTGTFIIPDKNGKTRKIKGKEGKKAFLNSPHAQEIAIDKYIKTQWGYIKSKKYNLTRFIGRKYDGFTITESGLIAAAHLCGIGKLNSFLKDFEQHGKLEKQYVINHYSDKNKVPLTEYMRIFAGYNFKEITKAL